MCRCCQARQCSTPLQQTPPRLAASTRRGESSQLRSVEWEHVGAHRDGVSHCSGICRIHAVLLLQPCRNLLLEDWQQIRRCRKWRRLHRGTIELPSTRRPVIGRHGSSMGKHAWPATRLSRHLVWCRLRRWSHRPSSRQRQCNIIISCLRNSFAIRPAINTNLALSHGGERDRPGLSCRSQELGR